MNYRPEDLDYAGGFGMEGGLTPEVKELLAKEGPRYQYGKGCLSDGVLGFWLGEMSGLSHLIDEDMLKTSLKNIFDNNFRADLSTHANPQRAGYAVKHDGGLLLCTWASRRTAHAALCPTATKYGRASNIRWQHI